jgi:para-nitrobenzyl esterase
MNSIGIALALAAALGWAGAATADGVRDVATDVGLVRGVREGRLTVYEGVPFAAPPVGDLRWREPGSAAPWRGVRAANRFAPACLQTGVSMPGETPPTVSEDCLYLNVWTPARRASERLPVLVWIYGGGFSNGSGAMPLYWGDRLARRGVVVVTFNYRVGPLGFLAHPELTAESAHRSSGNYGFEDQVAALRWVKRNITAFGGDPDRVTIAGQSAGAASVSVLMASPLAAGLFQGAIGESGGLFEPLALAPDCLLPAAEKEGVAYADSLGAHSLAELRALPGARLLEGKAGSVTHPVIEPWVLPTPPWDVFAAHHQARVPLLVGSNADEARSLTADVDKVTAAGFAADITRRWGSLPSPLIAAYPHATDAQARAALLGFERDLRFGWDDWAWARLQSASPGAPVYYYHFAHAPPFPAGSVYAGWGASHFSELWYVFDHLDQEPAWAWTAADRRTAATISGYWINFVKTGDPNGSGLPAWPRYRGEAGDVLYFEGDGAAVASVANLASLEVFDAMYAQVRPRPAK